MEQLLPLVLASGSPRRRRMLAELGLEFEQIPAGIEERRIAGEEPAEYALRAAGEKGLAVAVRLAGEGRRPCIVAADTIVVVGDEVLTKPADEDDARRMLGLLSGAAHTVITGWAVGRHDGEWLARCARTEVRFLDLHPREIEWYVSTGEGRDKAGAYAIQGLGAALVDRVDGNYHNVVGLPVSHVIRALRQLGALAEPGAA